MFTLFSCNSKINAGLAEQQLRANHASLPDTFSNSEVSYSNSAASLWRVAKAYWADKREHALPTKQIPVETLTADALAKIDNDSVIKLGHSSVLFKFAQQYILTDPVFSDRASPVQWMGPKRFHPAPITIEELPPIDAVVISHDHYDHLDKQSIQALAEKSRYFVTPLKVGRHLLDWGIPAEKIIELDWHQHHLLGDLRLTATPAQHFSGRGVSDKDETLWAGWIIESPQSRVFYSGDSGYFNGFKAIGEHYGPFDLTLIETGAYNSLWKEIHMLPAESLQAHLDLKGTVMMPVHNSTFDLALHDWNEPLVTISALATKSSVSLSIPKFGEIIEIHQAGTTNTPAWWLED